MGPESDYPVTAVPLPEAGSLDFLDFLDSHSAVLGKVGNATILWMPIDDPRRIDKAHRDLRSRQRATKEETDALRYVESCKQTGGADHFQRHEYEELNKYPMIRAITRPAILFRFRDVPGKFAAMSINPELLDTNPQRRALGVLLADLINEERFLSYTDAGRFSVASITRIQGWLDGAKKKMGDIITCPMSMFRPGSEKFPIHIPRQS